MGNKYKMIPVTENTKRRLSDIKKNLNGIEWEAIAEDWVDILEKAEVEERDELAHLKLKIMEMIDDEWRNGVR